MRCPGQDTRSWTADMAFDVPCPRCAHPVEVFKDEPKARCRRCGHRFTNPRGAFDCTTWCEFAEQCIGRAPSKAGALVDTALANRLMTAVEAWLRHDESQFARSLLMFQHAGELLSRVGGDPRVVLAAALLLPHVHGHVHPGSDKAGRTTGESPADTPGELLRSVELDESVIVKVVQLLEAFREEVALDTPEFRVLNDARLLTQAATEFDPLDMSPRDPATLPHFLCEAAQRRARELFARTVEE